MVANPARNERMWHASYAQTYLERDVRMLRQIGDLSQFQIFLRALAARSAQLLNLADLSRDLGVALNTVDGRRQCCIESNALPLARRPGQGRTGPQDSLG